MSKKDIINKETVLGDIVKLKGSDKVLHDNRVPCITCPMAKMEMDTLKVGQICNMYGLDEKKLLKELNKLNTKFS
jgi:hypothetical protein